jgi:hypothetical protein
VVSIETRGGTVPSLAPILKKITPAVVSIETRGRITPDPKSPRSRSGTLVNFRSATSCSPSAIRRISVSP